MATYDSRGLLSRAECSSGVGGGRVPVRLVAPPGLGTLGILANSSLGPNFGAWLGGFCRLRYRKRRIEEEEGKETTQEKLTEGLFISFDIALANRDGAAPPCLRNCALISLISATMEAFGLGMQPALNSHLNVHHYREHDLAAGNWIARSHLRLRAWNLPAFSWRLPCKCN